MWYSCNSGWMNVNVGEDDNSDGHSEDDDSCNNDSEVDEESSEKDSFKGGQGCVGGTGPYQAPEIFRSNTIASELVKQIKNYNVIMF
jgi:hypothetical protein